MPKVAISVIIPTKNEERNIVRCLNSIRWADQIFVVDSQSTDQTITLAQQQGAEVVQFQYQSPYPKKKNWSLDNLPIHNRWVFILDADETLPPEAEQEFRTITKEKEPPIAGYWINRRFHFMGNILKHAYFPNWNLRLFLHQKGRYEKLNDLETHSGDNEVHEHVEIDGETGRLKSIMEHYAFPDMETFIEKHLRYASWEARSGLTTKSLSLQDPSLRRRRMMKRWSQYLPFRPLLRFCYVYFWQKGFLDGAAGFHFARLHKIYEEMILIKQYELRNDTLEEHKK